MSSLHEASESVRMSVDQFRAELGNLSPIDLIKLAKKASIFAAGSGWTGQDLLHEAIARTLSGDGRNCPVNVPIKVFLANAMRSIADAERQKARRMIGEGASLKIARIFVEHPDDAPAVADAALARVFLTKTRADLEKQLETDAQALAILLGTLENWSPEEIRQLESMDDLTYDAARKRLRRIVERRFGGAGS